VGVNIAADLALFPVLGVRGLALGHAIAYTVAAVTAGVLLRRRLGGLEGPSLAGGLARIVAASTLTAAAAWGAARLMFGALGADTFGEQMVQVGAGVLAGVIIYVGAALLFRMEELALVKRTLSGRLRR
jgi:putative peptidoglycan lipid II flippase